MAQIDDQARLALWCHAKPDDAAREIERLRGLLREVMDGAWEHDFDDYHSVDSEIIGKVASYLVALTNGDR